jgi:hypothetical protein
VAPLLCPKCSSEASPGAYICGRCGYSFINDRSRPFAGKLLGACLAGCVVSLGICLAGLLVNETLSAASVIAFVLAHAWFIQYYVLRLAQKEAGLGPGVRTASNVQGWVANDALPLLILWVFPLAAWFPKHAT